MAETIEDLAIELRAYLDEVRQRGHVPNQLREVMNPEDHRRRIELLEETVRELVTLLRRREDVVIPEEPLDVWPDPPVRNVTGGPGIVAKRIGDSVKLLVPSSEEPVEEAGGIMVGVPAETAKGFAVDTEIDVTYGGNVVKVMVQAGATTVRPFIENGSGKIEFLPDEGGVYRATRVPLSAYWAD